MARLKFRIGIVLQVLLLIQTAESVSKSAKAMNVTNISFRSYEQSNSTRHIASSRNNVELDNSVNEKLLWQNEANCGEITLIKTTPRKNARVIGGLPAESGKWPWMAMIMRYYVTSGFSQTCGGTLIKPQWVLTAGHCFMGDPTSYTHVVIGTYYREPRGIYYRRFAIAKYICHHLFIGSSNAYEDDACLIKLAGPAEYSNYIKPVCLPEVGQSIVANETCSIAGWGVTSVDIFGSATLHAAKVDVVEKDTCRKWYLESLVTLPEHHFCAGYEKGGIDSCQGDSGGPLVCDRPMDSKQRVVQFGITSFGIGCAEAKRPGVYTEVGKYTKWIETKIQENSEPDSCFNETNLLPCGSLITASGTTIRSPVDSTRTWLYPPNSECSWDIKAPLGHGIQMQFNCFFHIEINRKNHSECYDYIKVSSNTGFQSVYCGTTQPNPINILGNEVTLSFFSDGSVQSSGFVIEVTFIPPPLQLQPNASFTDSSTQPKSSNKSNQAPVSTKKCVNGDCGSTSSLMTRNTSHVISFAVFVMIFLTFVTR